ncbi:MAG: hypothetical protein COV36_06535 [Alphaproteobacteria bacterium CG11_big_fil_rev_8_21_14_0_20_44_7]|nr:MAG: hypothetical protein COV36_06535 [Alphaproteobacteria bacterium CG11_big_fil_rev_8_21_14_0_20_44_7]
MAARTLTISDKIACHKEVIEALELELSQLKHQALDATLLGNIDTVREYLEIDASYANDVAIYATTKDYTEILDLAIQYGADNFYDCASAATRAGYEAPLERILQEGLSDEDLETLAVIACREGKAGTLELIIDANPNANDGAPALAEIAISRGHAQVAGFLFKREDVRRDIDSLALYASQLNHTDIDYYIIVKLAIDNGATNFYDIAVSALIREPQILALAIERGDILDKIKDFTSTNFASATTQKALEIVYKNSLLKGNNLLVEEIREVANNDDIEITLELDERFEKDVKRLSKAYSYPKGGLAQHIAENQLPGFVEAAKFLNYEISADEFVESLKARQAQQSHSRAA